MFAPEQMATTVRLALVNLLVVSVIYYVLSWLPQLVADAGFDPSEASLVAATANLAGIAGGVAMGLIARRAGLIRVTVAAIALLGVSLAALGVTPASLPLLFLAAGICGFFVFSTSAGYYAILALAFRDEARASGSGFVIGVGRISSALTPPAGRSAVRRWLRPWPRLGPVRQLRARRSPRARDLSLSARTCSMTFLRNCWYMAAWLDELPAEGGLARTFLDEPVFLFRDDAGAAHALLDRCPHRFAPLSRGKIEGDAVVCAYHGLAFDGSGACLRNPHGPVLRSLAVRSYPVAEAHRALWIWMGDKVRADLPAIPELSFLSAAPETAFNRGYVHGAGNYQLYVDNILDLSHTDYLHPTTLGGGVDYANARKGCRKTGRRDYDYLARVRRRADAPVQAVSRPVHGSR